MKNKKRSENSTFLFVFIFLGFLCVLLIGSATFKFLSVWSRNIYDSSSQFHVAIQNEQEKNKVQVVSFAPKRKSITIAVASSKQPISSNVLRIPVDAPVYYSSEEIFEVNEIEKQLWYFLMHYISVKTPLTFLDIANLYWYTKTVPAQNITVSEFIIPDDEQTIDARILRLFKDEEMVSEKKSIQIVNATGKSGVGNRFARLLTNMGGNVVDVTTANTATSSSRITFVNAPGYTTKRLSSILNVPAVVTNSQGISDILILVGEDALGKVSF